MYLRRISLLLISVLLMGWMSFTLPAQAATDCNTKVLDSTSKSLLDKKEVTNTIDQLQTTGADVYVRAFEKTPNGSLEAYYRETVKACGNWAGPDGVAPKANLIFVAFGMDHTSVIYYGANWHSLDQKIDAIRANYLNTGLKAGNYTKAITGTLDAVKSGIQSPAGNSQNSSGASNPGPILVIALFVLLGVAVIVLLGLIGRRVYRHVSIKREQQRRHEEAQQSVNTSKEKAEKAFSTLMLRTDIGASNAQAELELRTLLLPPKPAKTYQRKLESLQKTLTDILEEHAALVKQYEQEPELTDSIMGCKQITAAFNTSTKNLRSIGGEFNALWMELDEINEQLKPENRKERLQAITESLSYTHDRLEGVTAYRTLPYDTRLAELQQRANALINVVESMTAWEHHEAINALSADEQSLSDEIADLQRVQQAIRQAPEELRNMHRSTEKLVSNSNLPEKLVRKYTNQLKSLDRSIDAYSEDPAKDAAKLLRHKDSLLASLENVANACRAEQRKLTTRRRSGVTRNSRSYSHRRTTSGSSSNTSSAVIFGYGGSDYGSSPSPSSSDYGGGSGGSWGGSSDFGGGSGGSW